MKSLRIPKAYQSVQAKRSGLSYPSGETDVPIQRDAKLAKEDTVVMVPGCGKCIVG